MESVELNSKGNFDTWEQSKLEELNTKDFNNRLGQDLLFEDNSIRVWQLRLVPNERFPFRKINTNYVLIAMHKGLAITRCSNGEITLLRLKKGDTTYNKFEGTEAIYDLENIGETVLSIHMLEFKSAINKDSSI